MSNSNAVLRPLRSNYSETYFSLLELEKSGESFRSLFAIYKSQPTSPQMTDANVRKDYTLIYRRSYQHDKIFVQSSYEKSVLGEIFH